MMTIGDVAKAADLPTKTVRYHADIGLVVPGGRSDSGYRLYGDEELARLVFVRRARSFGFPVDACRELLGLYGNQKRSSRDVKQLALARLAEIDARMAELKSLRADLSRLADACHGDGRPDCPILDTLAM